jgi:MFS family permease
MPVGIDGRGDFMVTHTNTPILSKYFILLFISLLISSYALYVLNSTVSLMVNDRGGTASFSGMLSTFFTCFACIARTSCGHIADRISRKSVILAGGIVLIFGTIMYAFVSSETLLVIFRCVQGLGYAAMNVGAITALVDIIPPERLGEGIGIYSLAYTISSSFAPTISIALINGPGYFWVFISTGVAVAVSFVVTLLFCDYETKAGFRAEKQQMMAQKQEEQCRNLDLCNGSNLKAFGMSIFERHTVIPALVQSSIQLSFAAVFVFMTLYAVNERIPHPGLFFIYAAMFAVVARVTAGRFADRNGSLPCLIVGLLISITSFLLLSYSGASEIYYTCGALYGFGSGLVAPILNREALASVPAHRRGAANGTFTLFSDVGVGLGSVIWGMVITATSCKTTFKFVGLWLCVSLAMSVLYYSKKFPASKWVLMMPALSTGCLAAYSRIHLAFCRNWVKPTRTKELNRNLKFSTQECSTMDCLVGKVKSAFKRMLFQLGGVDVCGKSFCFVQGLLVTDIQFVDKNGCARMAVIRNTIHAVSHLFYHLCHFCSGKLLLAFGSRRFAFSENTAKSL